MIKISLMNINEGIETQDSTQSCWENSLPIGLYEWGISKYRTIDRHTQTSLCDRNFITDSTHNKID